MLLGSDNVGMFTDLADEHVHCLCLNENKMSGFMHLCSDFGHIKSSIAVHNRQMA